MLLELVESSARFPKISQILQCAEVLRQLKPLIFHFANGKLMILGVPIHVFKYIRVLLDKVRHGNIFPVTLCDEQSLIRLNIKVNG